MLESCMDFEIIGEIKQPETFARGSGIRELNRLRKIHGLGNWRKRKGYATVRLPDESIREAEFIGMKPQVLVSVNSKLSVIRIYHHEQARICHMC